MRRHVRRSPAAVRRVCSWSSIPPISVPKPSPITTRKSATSRRRTSSISIRKTGATPTARIDIDTFRDKILQPILIELKKRSLDTQIDSIIYSSGFPWAINFSSDLPPPLRNSQFYQNPEASISGLTYLLFPVAQKQVLEYTSFTANHYMRLRDKFKGATYEIPVIPDGVSKGLILPYPDTGPKPIPTPSNQSSVGSHGFRSWYGWGDKGELKRGWRQPIRPLHRLGRHLWSRKFRSRNHSLFTA